MQLRSLRPQLYSLSQLRARYARKLSPSASQRWLSTVVTPLQARYARKGFTAPSSGGEVMRASTRFSPRKLANRRFARPSRLKPRDVLTTLQLARAAARAALTAPLFRAVAQLHAAHYYRISTLQLSVPKLGCLLRSQLASHAASRSSE